MIKPKDMDKLFSVTAGILDFFKSEPQKEFPIHDENNYLHKLINLYTDYVNIFGEMHFFYDLIDDDIPKDVDEVDVHKCSFYKISIDIEFDVLSLKSYANILNLKKYNDKINTKPIAKYKIKFDVNKAREINTDSILANLKLISGKDIDINIKKSYCMDISEILIRTYMDIMADR